MSAWGLHFSHVDRPEAKPFQAHRESPESLPAFPVPTLRTVRRGTRDPLYGDTDGHADGFKSPPRDLGLSEDAIWCGGAILFFVWIWLMSGGLV